MASSFSRNYRYAMDPSSDAAARTAEMMARFLGPDMMAGIANEYVTGIALNPTDGAVRFDTRSRGRLVTGEHLTPSRVLQFLNAAATHVGATLTPDQPLLQAELPRVLFRGARLQGFVPPVPPGLHL
jgi:Flp pilus assembly CpaF family ATPase